MYIQVPENLTAEQIVKRAMFLAYEASSVFGMGAFQAVDDVNEEQVWERMYNRGDYPGGNTDKGNRPGNVYADYVFGRMMKTGFSWNDTKIDVNDTKPRIDYQSWSLKYEKYSDLIEAAIKSLT